MKTIVRCPWADSEPLLATYHDEEWGKPLHDSRALWEMLMLEGFQAGLSWLIVLRKREAFCKAFHNFDPVKVARMKEADVLRLLQDPGIIRSRSKIEATIGGAHAFLKMQKDGEDLAELVWKMAGGQPVVNTTGKVHAKTFLSEEISKTLKKRGFKFVGPVIVYAWLQTIGVADDHDPRCFRRHMKLRSSNY